MKIKLFQQSNDGQMKGTIFEEIYQMEINDCLEVGGNDMSDIDITTTDNIKNEYYIFRDKLDIDIQSDNQVTISRIPLDDRLTIK